MSAFPPKADIHGPVLNVCFVPIADMRGYVRHVHYMPKAGNQAAPLSLRFDHDRRIKHDWFSARGRRNNDLNGPISGL